MSRQREASQTTLPTSAVNARFSRLFTFPHFNIVQSACLSLAYGSNDNLVVSAPTGSGKTVVFELAICRLIEQSEKRGFKVIYQAPTKSLCSERQRDWSSRFAALGLRVAELTGDSSTVQIGSIQHADIIITTPEKWDSITRKWLEHQRFVSMVKLFLIDEVHTLKDDRGAVLEAVVSRMKAITQNIRIVALSATIPNTEDICSWLGKNSHLQTLPASCKTFEAGVRPVSVSTIVHGYPSNGNDYAFERSLAAHIPDLIQRYSQKKPILIFCSTRAACVETAGQLAQWWSDCSSAEKPWPGSRHVTRCEESNLQDLLSVGVALHHGGLSKNDRSAIESSYIDGNISVLCCTSTLATGVNLPCHMVVVKGTSLFSSSSTIGSRQYSDLEVIQMLGRAGRPQYGNTAVAIIMTRREHVEHYKKLSAGGGPIESRLHQNLIDHLNAEIVLGSVRDLHSAEVWLRSTFLYVRLKHNSVHYGIDNDTTHDIERHVKQICANGIEVLRQHQLVKADSTQLRSTAAGEAMARYYIQFFTATLFMASAPTASISELLVMVSKAAEFGDIFIRGSEKQMLTTMDKSAVVRFPLNVYIDAAWQKIYLIIQCGLAGAQPPDATANQQRDFSIAQRLINRQIHRLLKYLIECLAHLKHPVALRNALSLVQSLAVGAWEDSALSMAQLEGIGAAGVRKLTSMGVQCIQDVAAADSYKLERTFSRHPPFGAELIKKAKRFPQLTLVAKVCDEPRVSGGQVSTSVKVELGFMNEQASAVFNGKPIQVCLVAETSDHRLLHYQRISAATLLKTSAIEIVASLDHSGQSVLVHAMCEGIAGTTKVIRVDVDVLPGLFRQARESAVDILVTASPSDSTDPLRRQALNDTAGIDSNDLGSDDLAVIQSSEFMDVDDILDDETALPAHQARTLATVTSSQGHEDHDRRLPNGRWMCNHTCKNKSTCKHLCCREGLDKRPKPPKARPDHSSEHNTAKPLRQSSLFQHGLAQKSQPEAPSKREGRPPQFKQVASIDCISDDEIVVSRRKGVDKAASGESTVPLLADDNFFSSSIDAMDIAEVDLVDMQSRELPHQPAVAHNSTAEHVDVWPFSDADVGMHGCDVVLIDSSSKDMDSIVKDCRAAGKSVEDVVDALDSAKPQSVVELARAYLGEQYFIFLDT